MCVCLFQKILFFNNGWCFCTKVAVFWKTSCILMHPALAESLFENMSGNRTRPTPQSWNHPYPTVFDNGHRFPPPRSWQILIWSKQLNPCRTQQIWWFNLVNRPAFDRSLIWACAEFAGLYNESQFGASWRMLWWTGNQGYLSDMYTGNLLFKNFGFQEAEECTCRMVSRFVWQVDAMS